jgi:hypothetical protein
MVINMKGLYRYLSPFAPDQSGAVSVLFELGGIIIVCDAGGCTGNICGFDEPRWFTHKSALFSAGIRDVDAILGRDDRLMNKIEDALSQLDCNFIALIGTPVPSVIGTDFNALLRIANKRFGLPVLTAETTGMDWYDRGQEKAYMSLFKTYASNTGDDAPDIGIIGATPLDIQGLHGEQNIITLLHNCGYGKVVCYGMGSSLDDIKKAGAARCNLIVSPCGIKTAQYLKMQFGTPYVTGFPLTNRGAEGLKSRINSILSGSGENKPEDLSDETGEGILIIHQQFLANELRQELRAMNYCGRIDVASWFMLDKNYAGKDDICLHEEDELLKLLISRKYKMVAGDPLLKAAVPGWKGDYIDLPHFAISGGIYIETDIDECLQKLKQYISLN